jgi:hypothetical protein
VEVFPTVEASASSEAREAPYRYGFFDLTKVESAKQLPSAEKGETTDTQSTLEKRKNFETNNRHY